MKATNYLNGVLTVIAVCLIFLLLVETGTFPKANAGGKETHGNNKYITLPLNSDGSMNVKIVNSTMDVNIDEVGGIYVHGTIPVKLKE